MMDFEFKVKSYLRNKDWPEVLNKFGHELMGFDLRNLTDEELDVERDFGSIGGSLREIYYDQVFIDLEYLKVEKERERLDMERSVNNLRYESEYGPEFNNGLKIKIRIRDNDTCQNPQCNGASIARCVHHIDYDKWNNDPFNLITLCKSCDIQANYNREWWLAFYKTIQQRRGISQ